jgi:two-component system chemotaxis response regulator CheY
MKKVLVADDKATGRELVRTVLENTGYEVFEASDGTQAVDQARRLRPDLIILDIHMPGLDGFGVIEMLRREEGFAATPIIALTASAMMGIVSGPWPRASPAISPSPSAWAHYERKWNVC